MRATRLFRTFPYSESCGPPGKEPGGLFERVPGACAPKRSDGAAARQLRLYCAAIVILAAPLEGILAPPALAQRIDRAAAQPIPHGQDAVPNPPRTPAEAIKAMTVPPGFQVELVAAEPDIVNPVAMTFDERGRIWITESLEYPRRRPGPGRDRVKILEDTDGDGKADRFTIFADGLNIPSGIAVGHGGVWVANSPDILFMQDRDGDGKADFREVVATGFGRDDTHELPNSLTWGPDGWLYGWNGVFNPSEVVSRNGKRYEFTCAIFRIHPTTRVFEVWCEGTSNPWGIAIDPEGSFFSSACVIDHLWHLVETGYYIRQGGPYPPFTWPIESIVDHKHQKAAYCGIHYFDSPAYPRGIPRQALHGQHPRQCDQRRRAQSQRLDLSREAPARFPARQRLLVHAGRAEDRPRRVALHPRLVRPLSLLPGRQSRPRRHRPAEGAAVPRAVQRDAPARGI